MTQHIMLDIETLGLRPGCSVVSVAMVRLSDLQSMQINLDRETQGKVGLLESQETLIWWGQQSHAAQAAAFLNPHDARTALAYVGQWMRWAIAPDGNMDVAPDPWFLWCHGAGFDAPILEYAFERFGLQAPWRYDQIRDTRTLYDLAGVNLWDFSEGERHIAINDAMCQAKAAIQALRCLAPKKTRYFWHPESDCAFETHDGSQPTDPLVEEITGGEYFDILAREAAA
jgi:hypothetical protein